MPSELSNLEDSKVKKTSAGCHAEPRRSMWAKASAHA